MLWGMLRNIRGSVLKCRLGSLMRGILRNGLGGMLRNLLWGIYRNILDKILGCLLRWIYRCSMSDRLFRTVITLLCCKLVDRVSALLMGYWHRLIVIKMPGVSACLLIALAWRSFMVGWVIPSGLNPFCQVGLSSTLMSLFCSEETFLNELKFLSDLFIPKISNVREWSSFIEILPGFTKFIIRCHMKRLWLLHFWLFPTKLTLGYVFSLSIFTPFVIMYFWLWVITSDEDGLWGSFTGSGQIFWWFPFIFIIFSSVKIFESLVVTSLACSLTRIAVARWLSCYLNFFLF